jgi:hypothetical protein
MDDLINNNFEEDDNNSIDASTLSTDNDIELPLHSKITYDKTKFLLNRPRSTPILKNPNVIISNLFTKFKPNIIDNKVIINEPNEDNIINIQNDNNDITINEGVDNISNDVIIDNNEKEKVIIRNIPVDNKNIRGNSVEHSFTKTEKRVKKKKYKIPDYNSMSENEQIRYRTRFKSQFFLLRDTWGNSIPEINDNMSLYELHELYESYIKNMHVKDKSGRYKVYLVIMWMVIEAIGTKIGLNCSGYTYSQFKSMNKYERLLLELGEKYYQTGDSEINNDWPVEFNILFMALINAITFIIIKILADYLGEGVATQIVDWMSSYLSDSNPKPSNMLFDHNTQTNESVGNNHDAPDPVKFLMNMGNMYFNSQKPQQTNTNNNVSNHKRFKPEYDG